MSEAGFKMAADGWCHVSPLGEFVHAGAGVVQVVDREACDAIVADFRKRKAQPNFPGYLVDYDHFSLDADKPTEAAGWVDELEARDDGLWARVRWSDAGLKAVEGGRYRLMSPVFPPADDCESLGGGRVRPRRLLNIALTNEPNIKGARPLANRRTEAGGRRPGEEGGEEEGDAGTTKHTKYTKGGQGTGDGGREAGEGDGEAGRERSTRNVQRSTLKGGEGIGNRKTEKAEPAKRGELMSGEGAKRFMWILGETASGRHCEVCLERNGKVKTLLEWLREGPPKCHCKCRLAEVGKDVPEGFRPPIPNRWTDTQRLKSEAVRLAKYGPMMGLEPWGDEARRRAAEARARNGGATSGGGTYPDGRTVIRDLVAEVTSGRHHSQPRPGETALVASDSWEKNLQRRKSETYLAAQEMADLKRLRNDFIVALATMGGAAMGAARPAGAAGPALGFPGRAERSALARRRGLAEIGRKALDLLYPGGPRVPTKSELAEDAQLAARRQVFKDILAKFPKPKAWALDGVHEKKEAFRISREFERKAIVDELVKIKGPMRPAQRSALEAQPTATLKAQLRALGGDPEALPYARTKNANPQMEDLPAELRRRFGLKSGADVKAPARADFEVAKENAVGFLKDQMGDRPSRTVDQHLRELRDVVSSASRSLSKTKRAVIDAQFAHREAVRKFGEGSPEAAQAAQTADGEAAEFLHTKRMLDMFSSELRKTERVVGDFRAAAEEKAASDPFARPAELDLDRLLRVMRIGPLANRWSDVARAASLAVRRAKASARERLSKALEAPGWEPDEAAAREARHAVERGERPDYVDPSVRIGRLPPDIYAMGRDEFVRRFKRAPKSEKDSALVREYAMDAIRELSPGTADSIAAGLAKAKSARAAFGSGRLPDAVFRLGVEAFVKREGREPDWKRDTGEVKRLAVEEWQRIYDEDPERAEKMKADTVKGKTMKNRCAVERRKMPLANWNPVAWARSEVTRLAKYGPMMGLEPWGDEARRRAAEARARNVGVSSGGTYADGKPVVRDLVSEMSGYAESIPRGTYVSAPNATVQELSRKYAEALRRKVAEVARVSDAIEQFNATVASMGGLAAAAAGAGRPLGPLHKVMGTSRATGRIGRDQAIVGPDGKVTGWGRVSDPYGGRAAARRRPGPSSYSSRGDGGRALDWAEVSEGRGTPSKAPSGPAAFNPVLMRGRYPAEPVKVEIPNRPGMMSADPLSKPITQGDFLFRQAYQRRFEEIAAEPGSSYDVSSGGRSGGVPDAAREGVAAYRPGRFQGQVNPYVPGSDAYVKFAMNFNSKLTKEEVSKLEDAMLEGAIELAGKAMKLPTGTDAEAENRAAVFDLVRRFGELQRAGEIERADAEGLLPMMRDRIENGPPAGESGAAVAAAEGGVPYESEKVMPTFGYPLVDIPADVVRAAVVRADKDPAAEYHVGDGIMVIAADVAKALREGADEVPAFKPYDDDPNDPWAGGDEGAFLREAGMLPERGGYDPIAEREELGRESARSGMSLREMIEENGLDLDNDADMAAVTSYRQERRAGEASGVREAAAAYAAGGGTPAPYRIGDHADALSRLYGVKPGRGRGDGAEAGRGKRTAGEREGYTVNDFGNVPVRSGQAEEARRGRFSFGPRAGGGHVRTFPAPKGTGGEASTFQRDAARALGVLHGMYGTVSPNVMMPDGSLLPLASAVAGEGYDGARLRLGDESLVNLVPPELLPDYEAGLAEGKQGYQYEAIPPADRAAVFRAANAYLEEAARSGEEKQAPDHLGDRTNAAIWPNERDWRNRNKPAAELNMTAFLDALRGEGEVGREDFAATMETYGIGDREFPGLIKRAEKEGWLKVDGKGADSRLKITADGEREVSERVAADAAEPDNRGWFENAGLVNAGLEWFRNATAAGDKPAANAALAYVADLLVQAREQGGRGELARQFAAEEGEEVDAPEIDAGMPEFDEDGVELDGASPFFEDSYADPNARMPWEYELDRAGLGLRNRRRPGGHVLCNRHAPGCAYLRDGSACTCERRKMPLANWNPAAWAKSAVTRLARYGKMMGLQPWGDEARRRAAEARAARSGGLGDAAGKSVKGEAASGGVGGGQAGGQSEEERAAEEWDRRRADAFRGKYGREPDDEGDMEKGRELAGLPETDDPDEILDWYRSMPEADEDGGASGGDDEPWKIEGPHIMPDQPFLPLRDDVRDEMVKRIREHNADVARKKADLERLREERARRRREREAPVADKLKGGDLAAKFPVPGAMPSWMNIDKPLSRKWLDEERAGYDRLMERIRERVAAKAEEAAKAAKAAAGGAVLGDGAGDAGNVGAAGAPGGGAGGGALDVWADALAGGSGLPAGGSSLDEAFGRFEGVGVSGMKTADVLVIQNAIEEKVKRGGVLSELDKRFIAEMEKAGIAMALSNASRGWQDEARAAAYLSRLRNLALAGALKEGPRNDSTGPTARGAGADAAGAAGAAGGYAGIRAMPPGPQGTLITKPDGVYVMDGGRPVKIGGSEHVKVGSSGNLILIGPNGQEKDLGSMDFVGRQGGRLSGGGRIVKSGSGYAVDFGGYVYDLTTGGMRRSPTSATGARGRVDVAGKYRTWSGGRTYEPQPKVTRRVIQGSGYVDPRKPGGGGLPKGKIVKMA